MNQDPHVANARSTGDHAPGIVMMMMMMMVFFRDETGKIEQAMNGTAANRGRNPSARPDSVAIKVAAGATRTSLVKHTRA